MSSPGYHDDGAHSPNKGPDIDQVYSVGFELANRGHISEAYLYQHPLLTARASRWLTPPATDFAEPTHEIFIPIDSRNAYLSLSDEGAVSFELSDPDNPFLEATFHDRNYHVSATLARLITDFLSLFGENLKPDDSIAPELTAELRQKLAEILELSSCAEEAETPSMEEVVKLKGAIKAIAARVEPGYVATNTIELPDRDSKFMRSLFINSHYQQSESKNRGMTIEYSYSDHRAFDDRLEKRLVIDGDLVMYRSGSALTMDEIRELAENRPKYDVEQSELDRLTSLVMRGYRYAWDRDIARINEVLAEAAEQ
jgi:hypothetical protein